MVFAIRGVGDSRVEARGGVIKARGGDTSKREGGESLAVLEKESSAKDGGELIKKKRVLRG